MDSIGKIRMTRSAQCELRSENERILSAGHKDGVS